MGCASAAELVKCATCGVVVALALVGHATAISDCADPVVLTGGSQWSVIFEEQFEGSNSTATGVDESVWSFDIGNKDMSDPANPGPGGWGNGEPQYYTNRPENAKIVSLPGGSALQITALNETFEGFWYTSARINSKKHPVAGSIMPPTNQDGTWVDGGAVRVEFLAKLSEGSTRGTWPALWMLPTAPQYGAWPFSGEIDIMESRKLQHDFSHGLWFGGPWSHRANPNDVSPCLAPTDEASAARSTCSGLPAVEACNARFRIWALEWAVHYRGAQPAMSLTFLRDDRPVRRFSSDEWWANSATDVDAEGNPVKLKNPLAPFDQPFHIIINLAVGGWFSEYPELGAYEQHMLIDYVKVLQRIPA